MPRGKKRQTPQGEDAQDIGSTPGQRYGEGVEQQAMQRAMPSPDRTDVPAAPPAQPGQPPAGAPVDPAASLAGAPLGLLNAPSDPNIPITDGLTSGAGAGPEALGPRQTTPLGRMLRELHARTGDPLFRDLAERARL